MILYGCVLGALSVSYPAPCEEYTKMYRIVVLVLCYNVLSQPVSDEASPRVPRELIECCPCPGASARDAPWGGALGRADDCPCRAREADSDGAASLFFPTALRPDASHLKPIDPKEDPKNLLEPEVALATSVLDTLREATEEEYRDALEREAASNVAETDAVPEESARNVVIVLNPEASDDEDFISDASHVQEPRCIHPLGRTPFDTMRASADIINNLPDLFKLHKENHIELPQNNLLLFDNSLGASNAEEKVVGTDENVPKLSIDNPKQKQTLSLKNIFDNKNSGFRFIKPKSELGNLQDKSTEGLKFLLGSKLTSRTNSLDDDLSSAPSNVHHQLESKTDKATETFNDKLPLSLRNLLKLRDVELIPKRIRNKSWTKPKLDVSKFAIPSLFQTNRNNNCDDKTKAANDVVLNLENEEPELTDGAADVRIEEAADLSIEGADDDSITDASTVENTEEITNLMRSQNKISSENTINFIPNENVDENDEDENSETELINIDVLSSPYEAHFSNIIDGNTRDLKSNVLPKSAKSDTDCNGIILEDSSLKLESEDILDKLNKIDYDATDFENTPKEDIRNEDGELTVNKLKTDEDSVTDSSNTVSITTIPLEKQEENTVNSEDISEKGNNYFDEVGQITSNNQDRFLIPRAKQLPPLSETLSNLRETVVKQLENLKKPLLEPKLSKTPTDSEKPNEEGFRHIDHNQLSTNIVPTEIVDVKSSEIVSDISMNDLQNMSDKLLDSGLIGQTIESNIVFNDGIAKDRMTFQPSEIKDKSDSDLSETRLSSVDTERGVDDANKRGESLMAESPEENACSTNIETKIANFGDNKAAKSAHQDLEQKEMEVGASETVIDTLPGILDSFNTNLKLRSPLLNDMVLQPSNDPLNLLGQPLGDVFSLNSNLPTLEDIRERLVNIFNIDNESNENDSTSLEADFTNISPVGVMATESSTRNSQKESPLLKQLHDFNNGISMKKPNILLPFDTQKKSQLIDLNSYRAHLPSPNSLDLKPITIRPRLQNKADKPSIVFGSERTLTGRTKPTSTFVNPLDNIPTLEELRSTLLSNTKNVLKTPVHPDLNAFSENLRSRELEDVAKNIRLNTEKTFRGIQRKMKSTFRNSQSHSPLRDTLAKPQDLLEDMNDKLKGLHYDLNDRLSSIRESILDSTKAKSLVDQPRKASNKNVMTNIRKPNTKSSSPRLHAAASTIKNQQIDSHALNLEPRNHVAQDLDRSQKQTAAESDPARIEMPKSVKPTLPSLHKISLFRETPGATDFLKGRTPTQSLTKDTLSKNSNNPVFRGPFTTRRQQNKVSISFSTTPRPILPPRPMIRIPNKSASQFEDFNPSTSSSNVHILSDPNVATNFGITSGKFKPLRTSAPLPSPIDEDFEDTLNNFSAEDIPSSDAKFKSSILRVKSKPDNLKLRSNFGRFKSDNIFEGRIDNEGRKPGVKIASWRTVTENSLLPKVRDDIRKSSNGLKPVIDERNEQLDMLRSPSENNGIVMDEPLKENVSYRCKMVCTKEIK